MSNEDLNDTVRNTTQDLQAVNTLAKTMIEICSKLIENASVDRTVGGVITNLPDPSGKYLVQVATDEYRLNNGTNIDFKKGDPVWVTMPSGSLRKMYISAKRGK